MRTKFKGVSLVVATFVALTVLLPGCSSKSGTDTTTAPATTAKTSSEAVQTTAKQELPAYEITIVLPGAEKKDMPLVQDEINKITKEKLNATLKFTTIAFASWVQQTNLMIASNEKVDLLWTASFMNYNANVAKGQFLPLDELIEKYGGDVKSVLGTSILDAARVNGKIYGVPSVRDFAADYGFVMRKDMVEKHNIDTGSIKKPEDMTAVLKTIKEKEPQLIPFATTQNMTITELIGLGEYDKLDNWMGVTALNDNSLKVVNFFETQLYKDILKLVRGWYQAGYLSKDASTSKETPDSLVKADKAFAYAYGGKPGIATQEGKKTGKDMVYVPLTSPVSTTSNITNGMMSIAVNSKDPDRSMMLLNLWYSDAALVNIFDNGIEGTHYVKGADNLLDFPSGLNAANTGYTPINFRVGNNFLAYIWKGDPADLWKQMDEFNKGAVKSKALGFAFDSEPVKTEVASVTNVINQYRMGLDTGTLDPDKTLPEYNSKFKAAGLDKIIAEKQAQLEKWSQNMK